MRHRSGFRGFVAFGLVWVLCAGGPALAQDAVKLSGFWIDQVTVRSIDGGQVHYQTASGKEMSRPIEALQGLRLERYSGLAQAFEAIAQANDPAAVKELEGVYADATEPWLRGYVGNELVKAHARLGDADRAAAVYVDMVVSGEASYFIAEPPTQVVGQALPAVKRRVIELAKAGQAGVGQSRALLLQQLIDTAQRVSETVEEDLTESQASASSGASIVLSASVPPSPIVNLILRGQFEQAIQAADRLMDRPERMASLLYLKGMARLGIAQRDENRGAYKSAGLDFMRVQVYFPQSAVSGPATLEAGYVHQMIGRPDLALQLYIKARPLIDEAEDPVYHARLMELNQAINTEEHDE